MRHPQLPSKAFQIASKAWTSSISWSPQFSSTSTWRVSTWLARDSTNPILLLDTKLTSHDEEKFVSETDLNKIHVTVEDLSANKALSIESQEFEVRFNYEPIEIPTERYKLLKESLLTNGFREKNGMPGLECVKGKSPVSLLRNRSSSSRTSRRIFQTRPHSSYTHENLWLRKMGFALSISFQTRRTNGCLFDRF